MTAALPAWVTARVVVLAALGLAAYVASKYSGTDPRLAGPHPGYWGWDAGWYEAIASRGYGALDREALRFFPLLPLLGRGLALLLAGSERLALILIVNASALAVGAILHRLVVLEKSDDALASRATWAVALFPAAFILVTPYAEALFMALTAGAFLAARSRRWRWCGAVGMLAGLARPLGGLLAVPMAIEAARGWRGTSVRNRIALAAAALAPLAGTALYLAWVGVRFADPWLPVRIQQRANLRGELAPVPTTLAKAVARLLSGDGAGAALHLPWLALFVALAVVAFRRWPASYGALAALTLAAAVSTGNLDSLERYCFSAFPFALAAASLVPERLEASVGRGALALAAAGLSTYAFLAFLGPYIP
ncbi:MAG: hypothetical protein ACRD0Q_04430 [Acidimicrobiales bacterium]